MQEWISVLLHKSATSCAMLVTARCSYAKNTARPIQNRREWFPSVGSISSFGLDSCATKSTNSGFMTSILMCQNGVEIRFLTVTLPTVLRTREPCCIHCIRPSHRTSEVFRRTRISKSQQQKHSRYILLGFVFTLIPESPFFFVFILFYF